MSTALALLATVTLTATHSAGSGQPPAENWLKLGAIIAGIFIALLLIRWLLRLNKFLVLFVVVIGGGIWFFLTLYNRTEPKWATPLFDQLAHWFPTKDYSQRELQGPK